jgi:hypothetical protein
MRAGSRPAPKSFGLGAGLRQHHLARNQVAMPSAQLVNVHIHGVGLSERVVGKAMAVQNQSRQSADSVQPGRLVEAQI